MRPCNQKMKKKLRKETNFGAPDKDKIKTPNNGYDNIIFFSRHKKYLRNKTLLEKEKTFF